MVGQLSIPRTYGRWTRVTEREVELGLSLAQSTLRGRRSRSVDKPWRQASGGEKKAAGGGIEYFQWVGQLVAY
jgi:hypothetical protein